MTDDAQKLIHALFRLLECQSARLGLRLLALQAFAFSDVPVDLQNRSGLARSPILVLLVAYQHLAAFHDDLFAIAPCVCKLPIPLPPLLQYRIYDLVLLGKARLEQYMT